MPKQIVSDVFGEILETGKATAKAGKKAVSDIAGQAVKSITGQKTDGKSLDLMEKMTSSQSAPVVDPESEDKRGKNRLRDCHKWIKDSLNKPMRRFKNRLG